MRSTFAGSKLLVLATAATAATAAALLGVSFAGPAAAADGNALPACQARQLDARVQSSSGAGGTILMRIAIRNSGTACALLGYPELRLRKGKAAMPTRTMRGGLSILDADSDAVELSRTRGAFLLIAYSDAGAGSAAATAGTCPETTGVDLWHRGWKRPVRVRAMIAACDGGLIRTSPFLHPASSTATAR
jgi:hypothetical protein